MVNPFIVRVLAQVASTLIKSAGSAYKRVISENIRKGGAAQNPFTEFLGKTMQNANLINKPMTQDEALKILNLDGKELTPEQIMKSHMILFGKNEPLKGGSFYIQSKVFCAKEFLMSQYPGEEEKFMKEHADELKKGEAEKAEDEQKDEKPQDKKEDKADEPNSKK